MIKKYIITTSITLAIIFCGITWLIYYGALKWRSPEAQLVNIPPGASLRHISILLADKRVIGTPKIFEIYCRIKGIGKGLKAGTYEFPAETSLLSALDKIKRGDVKEYTLSIIEGWSARDTMRVLEGKIYLADANMPREYERLIHDDELIKSLNLGKINSLEGYLFPDTYHVSFPLTAAGLIRIQVARFKEVWATLDTSKFPIETFDKHSIVTLASIIEKETGAGNERPLISSVFVNRLKKGMLLQSDPTIIYGLSNYDGNIRKDDILNPHPYNTYVHPGLPPGPICSPGKAALEAAINPVTTNFIYFVAKNDGTHQFSETLAEHQQGVIEYQIKGKKGDGVSTER